MNKKTRAMPLAGGDYETTRDGGLRQVAPSTKPAPGKSARKAEQARDAAASKHKDQARKPA